jgi:rubrerythrin
MVLNAKLAPNHVLAAAIKSEIDAAAFYTELQGKVKNIILLKKLKFLAFEEEQHGKILTKLFSQRFPGQKIELPGESPLPPIGAALGSDPSVPELFNAALEAEKTSEAFYGDAGNQAEDEASRRILIYLRRVERSHAAVIRSEIDLLVKFPDYYRVEDFHTAQDLFHIGP